jgi:hypothetical protein
MNIVICSKSYCDGYLKAIVDSNPHLELSTGYVGNYRANDPHNKDDTHHYVWCHNKLLNAFKPKIHSDTIYNFDIGRGLNFCESMSFHIYHKSIPTWIAELEELLLTEISDYSENDV